MTLDAGTKLGPDEILSPLGDGGMGEVYLANDSKLDRKVAIKALIESMTRDLERVLLDCRPEFGVTFSRFCEGTNR